MTPIRFPEANKELTGNNRSLWVYTDGKQCISCWKLSWKQRLKALLFGKVWLSVLSGGTQPPVWLYCDKTIFEVR